jgi:hypothetical protein
VGVGVGVGVGEPPPLLPQETSSHEIKTRKNPDERIAPC